MLQHSVTSTVNSVLCVIYAGIGSSKTVLILEDSSNEDCFKRAQKASPFPWVSIMLQITVPLRNFLKEGGGAIAKSITLTLTLTSMTKKLVSALKRSGLGLEDHWPWRCPQQFGLHASVIYALCEITVLALGRRNSHNRQTSSSQRCSCTCHA